MILMMFCGADIKPFYLHLFDESQAYLCPLRALAEWIAVSGESSGYLFRKIMAGDRVDTTNRPIVRPFIVIFRCVRDT
jgi:hypothetical protein